MTRYVSINGRPNKVYDLGDGTCTDKPIGVFENKGEMRVVFTAECLLNDICMHMSDSAPLILWKVHIDDEEEPEPMPEDFSTRFLEPDKHICICRIPKEGE